MVNRPAGRTASALMILVSLLTVSAQAAISSTSGQVRVIARPADVRFNVLQDNGNIRAFPESQDVRLTSPLAVDFTQAKTYTYPTKVPPSPIPTIPANTWVSSYFFHADGSQRSTTVISLTGSVTFDSDVLGIVVSPLNLRNSDFLGSNLSPPTVYPTTNKYRGAEFDQKTKTDTVTLSADRRTVTVNLKFANSSTAPGDQVRVITTGTPDTTPPDTIMDANPSDPSASKSGFFRFHSTDPAGGSFRCWLDGVERTGCTSPYALTVPNDGTHTFAVAAVDHFGNEDMSPATYTWTVDSTAPETTITDPPTGTLYSSSLSIGFISSEVGSTFLCSRDGGEPFGCTSPELLEDLDDGPHTFTVAARDPSGNEDKTPATVTWTVDTTPSQIYTVNLTTDASSDGCTVLPPDGNGCTLREAIGAANGHSGFDAIKFDLPATPAVLVPNTPLPTITGPALVDGWSQDNPGGANAPTVELDGSVVRTLPFANPAGLSLLDNSTVRGLFIHDFTGQIAGGSRTTVLGNHLGFHSTPVDGSCGVCVGNYSVVGGRGVANRNVASGNGTGIGVAEAASVVGNYAGTDPSGTIAVPNGVGVSARPGSLIAGNVLSGNTLRGATTSHSDDLTPLLKPILIVGNRIGVAATGDDPLPNGQDGIFVDGPTIIGNTSFATGTHNVIAYNGRDGIRGFQPFGAATIGTNVMHSNGALGIEVYGLPDNFGLGVNENDAADPDTGEDSTFQNYPVISSVKYEAATKTLTIKAELHSSHDRNYRVQFFDNTSCDPSGHGEGADWWSSAILVKTNAVGFADITWTTTKQSPVNVVTAVATDLVTRETSEFSACMAAS